MPAEDIPFGMRRYRLGIAMFVLGGAGFLVWSRSIVRPTFVFPFGQREAPTAQLVLGAIGVLSIALGAVLVYVRFVKRPVVALREDSITVPVGEFGGTNVTLRAGDVLNVQEDGPRAGGWRTCRVRHRSGELLVQSSQLPSDEAFFTICERLRALQTS